MLRLFLAAALAARGLATLQDLANCDPLKKDSACPPDPAFADNVSFDFTTASWNDKFEDFWSVDKSTAKDKRGIDFDTKGKGAAFGLWEARQAPTVSSNKYLFFGKVTVEVQAAKGKGLVTAIVLKSDSGDEIDWELLGAYENQAQTNYFYDGEALFNTYNYTHKVDPSSFAAFHTYTIEWTKSALIFSIDGTERKTLRTGDIPAAKWPQTPMQVKLGLWAIDETSDTGEIQWAGGKPDWDAAPFKAHFKSVEIEDYMGGCEEASGDVEYLYSERTHGWEEVRIKGCQRKTTPGQYTPDIPSPPAETTASSGNARPETSMIDGSGTTEAPTATGTDEAAPPEATGGNEGGENGEDTEDKAPFAMNMSSPLAAVVCLVWLMIL